LRPLITAHQAAGTIAAVIVTPDAPQTIALGGYRLTASVRAPRRGQGEAPPRGYGIFFATGPDEFIVAGGDLTVRFTPATPGPAIAGLDRVEEGVFEGGQWRVTRVLNGDEVMLDYAMAQLAADRQTGTGLKFRSATPTIQRVTLYRYE
jgi:hypothetical protein